MPSFSGTAGFLRGTLLFLMILLSSRVAGYAETGHVSPLAEVSGRFERGAFPEIQGVVTTEIVRGYLFLQDASGAICLRLQDSHPFPPDDVIRARVTGYDGRDFRPIADTAVPVGREPLPTPLLVEGGHFSVAKHHGNQVTSGGAAPDTAGRLTVT